MANRKTLAENTAAEAPETAGAAEETGKAEAAEETAETLVYIGPSIPYSKLRSSMILKGTGAEIREYLGELTETYPEIPHLLAAPKDLPEALRRVSGKGTILHKYYQDMLAKSKAARVG